MLKKILILSIVFVLISSSCLAFEINIEQTSGFVDKIVAFFDSNIVPLWNKAVIWAESNLSQQTLSEIRKEIGEAVRDVPVAAQAIWDKVVELLK
ncbi:MAG: hypothetical protein PHD31_01075 [Candidatus Pacebacteria bacterium]|nr:hypothetical protein [Candidatus Paceibacterota bacterium]